MSKLKPEIDRQAAASMEKLAEATRPGDGMVMGVDPSGQRAIQVLWLVSDEPRLRTRMLSYEPRVRTGSDEDSMTVVFKGDPKIKHPQSHSSGSAKDSINYPAMFGMRHLHMLSNGIQTKSAMQAAFEDMAPKGVRKEMSLWGPYDDQDRTPRMTGLLAVLPKGMTWYSLMIARADPSGDGVEHIASSGNFAEHFGEGAGIGAYEGMDPDQPRLVLPIGDNGTDTLNMYRQAIGPANLSALAVKEIDLAEGTLEYTSINTPHLKQ